MPTPADFDFGFARQVDELLPTAFIPVGHLGRLVFMSRFAGILDEMSEISAWIGLRGARSPEDCCACYLVDYRPYGPLLYP